MPSNYGLRALTRNGFQIQKSADQRLCAPTRGLSQLITSFFGFWHQGIHHTPLQLNHILKFRRCRRFLISVLSLSPPLLADSNCLITIIFFGTSSYIVYSQYDKCCKCNFCCIASAVYSPARGITDAWFSKFTILFPRCQGFRLVRDFPLFTESYRKKLIVVYIRFSKNKKFVRNLMNKYAAAVLRLCKKLELVGIEPATSCLQSRRSPS